MVLGRSLKALRHDNQPYPQQDSKGHLNRNHLHYQRQPPATTEQQDNHTVDRGLYAACPRGFPARMPGINRGGKKALPKQAATSEPRPLANKEGRVL